VVAVFVFWFTLHQKASESIMVVVLFPPKASLRRKLFFTFNRRKLFSQQNFPLMGE
jgi:hypothetical protein